MAETTPLANNPVFADDGVIEGPPPDPAPSSVASEPQPAPSPISAGNTQPAPSWSVRAQTFLRPWLAWIVIGWSLGVVLCSARPLLGWHTLRRLRQTGISPVSNEVLAVLHHVSERLGLHCAVRLLQSTLTQVPVVVGYFRPVILLPVSLMTSIPAAQLEAILAHELAHVKRHDFVVNLLQMLVETLFFYHPAVWWLSHRIRVEREHCCDDLVVKLFDNRLEYGRALIAIEQLRGQNSVLALAATDGSLLARIRRLVGLNSQGNVSSPVERWPAAILSMALIGIIFLLTLNWSLSAKDEIQNSAGPDEKTNPERHQDWVTFENVAMQLGQETDVKVPVETEPREQPRAEQEAATVVGAVVSPDGKPVAGIEVLAFQGGKRLEQKFTTDERGEFRVPKAWREVDHWLTAVARDGRERLGWFDFMIHRHSIIGQNPEDGSFRLVLLPMSRTIRGRVLDESGQPLAQIPVRINQLDHEVNSTSVHWSFQKLGDEALVFGAVTDNDGRFELKLPASTFAWLGTSHPDWVESRIRVTKENDQVGDTKLVRAAKVAGRVIDSRTGKTLAGVTIAAHATKTEILESGGDEAKTDADGKFLIQGLRSGEYTIQLVKSPFRTLTAPALTGAVLKPGETFKADFALNFGKRLTGRVLDMDTGEPIPDCKVNCTSPAQPNGGLSMETNAQGEFEFIIPPGQSRLSSTEGRRFGNESTREVDVLADGDPEPVVLKVGPKIEPIPGDFKIFIGPPLDRKVSLHFQRTPLVEVLEHACQATAVKLELDGEGLKSVGYTKNMAVTIDADNVTLRDALTQLLKPHEKLSFTLDNNQLFISTRQQVEAREKQAAEPKGPTEEKKAGATSPPVGLEFLKPYPKLHGLSLDMTERQFLEIVKQQELKTRKTVDGDKVQYHIPLSDGHTLIVMFEKDAKCSGIQRVRGDERGEQSQVEHGSKSRLMTLLPGGRMIELVGVAHASLVTPSGTKRKVEGWWKADGTQLDKEPFTLSPLSVAANRQHFCEFAIRLQTRPKELATPEKLLLPPMHGAVWFGSNQELRRHAETWNSDGFLQYQLLVGFENEKPGTVSFYYSDALTVEAGVMDLDGKIQLSSEASAQTRALLLSLEVTGIQKSATETVVNIKPSARRGPMQVFVTAIRLDGTTLQPVDPTDNERHVFKVPAAELDGFRINLRPMTHRVVCENIALLPGQKTEPAMKVETLPAAGAEEPRRAQEPKTLWAQLPNGVEVELAGVAFANAAGPDGSRRRKEEDWWRADGTKLAAPPFKLFSVLMGENATAFREFAIQLTSPRGESLITAHHLRWSPHPKPGIGGVGGWVTDARTLREQERSSKQVQAAVYQVQSSAGFDEEQPIAVHVIVSDQPLGPAWLIGLDGKPLPQSPADATTTALRKLIQIVRIEDLQTGTTLRYKLSPDFEEWTEWEVRAIDKKGEGHLDFDGKGPDSRAARTTNNGHGQLFQLPAADISHFEIRLRPMTHKVTFENVSLVPGQMTDVKVKVEPINLLALNGLEFLKPYPKLHGLSLDMTEPQFLEIVQQQELKSRKTVEGEKVQHHITLGDGHTLIVMFDKDAKCSGIQRVRGEDTPVGVRTMRKPALLLPDHWIMQAVGFDNDGKELITASNQSFITIRRWDVVGMKLMSEIKLQADKHGRTFREGTLMFSGDRQRVVAATDAYVGIWETATGKLLKQLPFQTREGIYDCAIDKLDCTPDLSVIVGHRALPGRLTLSYDAHVIVWDGVSGNVLQTVIDKGATDLKAIDLSTDGKRLVTTNGSGAKIWETSTGQLIRSVPNDNTRQQDSKPDPSLLYTNHVWSLQFSPNGQQLAIGDILGVKLVDATSGKLLQQLEGAYRFSSGSVKLVFSKDGQWLARLGTGTRPNIKDTAYIVPIWSVKTGQKRFELVSNANAGAFSDDNQRLAIGFSDLQQALSVWTLSGDAVNVEQTAGPGPDSRQDKVEENGHYRGQKAAEFIDTFKPTWGEAKLGIQYGIALTKPQRQFRIGERVPLVVFVRNASDRPLKIDMRPDFFGNMPKVVDGKGVTVGFENAPLLGSIPHYVENLEPGEAVGPFYLNFGLGENPRPGKQYWHPYFKTPVAGQYKLTHSVSINVVGLKEGDESNSDQISSSQIQFEIVED